jgi:uncharacterized protein YijF (DUF1287 family)
MKEPRIIQLGVVVVALAALAAESPDAASIVSVAREQIGKTVRYDPSYQRLEVIHNIGAGVQEEDRLFEFKITGHYRIKQATN